MNLIGRNSENVVLLTNRRLTKNEETIKYNGGFDYEIFFRYADLNRITN